MHRFMLLATLAGSPGCADHRQSSQDPALPRGAQPIPSSPVTDLDVVQEMSGIDTRERRVVDNANDWQAIWRRIAQNQQPEPAPPTIDFNSDVVVLASMGTQSSGGFSVAIEGVYRTADKLYVVVREASPGKNCMTTAALTAPVAAVRMQRTGLPVEFLEHKTTQDC